MDFREVLLAMAHALRRAEMFTEHEIQLERYRCVSAWATYSIGLNKPANLCRFKIICGGRRTARCCGHIFGNHGTGA